MDLVIQSHRSPLPFRWLQSCLDSVSDWARANDYDYRYQGDEIFDLVPGHLLQKAGSQIVIASDLARLKAIQAALAEGFQRVVWLDADFLIFRPVEFCLPETPFALGREVWVQRDERQKLRAYVKLHNAFLMFQRHNHFLDFYIDTAERLLTLNEGGVPAQFIGPKFLTALHNIAKFPVMETAGMLSPAVMRDLLAGGGPALDLFHQKSLQVPAGANLSSSLAEQAQLGESEMDALIKQLLLQGL